MRTENDTDCPGPEVVREIDNKRAGKNFRGSG